MRAATRASQIACVAICLAVVFAGCGGDGGPPLERPDQPEPPSGKASIVGWVVSAQDTSVAIPGAQVSANPPSVTQQAGAGGAFRLQNLPAGQIQVTVQPSVGQAYWPAQFTVTTVEGQETEVVVALIPDSAAVPDRITVQPNQFSLDPGSLQTFTVMMWAGSVRSSLAPTWVVEGGVGTMGPPRVGVFHALKTGEGRIVAVVGTQTSESKVTVTAPQPPRIWSVFIDPTQLPATGGSSTFTVHATDGDGIKRVRADIYKPDGSHTSIYLDRAAGGVQNGTKWVDATFTKSYTFPRNIATPDPLGNQPVQTYDLRFQVEDNTGATTSKNTATGEEWYQVTVLGLEPPPPPAP